MTHIKRFNENFQDENFPLLTIDDFLESFPNFKVDYIEDNIDDFVHSDVDDFNQYIIVDDSIMKEKEYVLVDGDDNEIFIYTNNDDKINGYALNKD